MKVQNYRTKNGKNYKKHLNENQESQTQMKDNDELNKEQKSE